MGQGRLNWEWAIIIPLSGYVAVKLIGSAISIAVAAMILFH